MLRASPSRGGGDGFGRPLRRGQVADAPHLLGGRQPDCQGRRERLAAGPGRRRMDGGDRPSPDFMLHSFPYASQLRGKHSGSWQCGCIPPFLPPVPAYSILGAKAMLIRMPSYYSRTVRCFPNRELRCMAKRGIAHCRTLATRRFIPGR